MLTAFRVRGSSAIGVGCGTLNGMLRGLGRDGLVVLCVLAACADSSAEPAGGGGQPTEPPGAGPAGSAGAQGPKGDKGDKGDSTIVTAKEVIANKGATGGLPLSGTLTTTGGKLVLTVSGSGYRATAIGGGPLG